MEKFVLFSTPFWVNSAILIPAILFIYWRKHKLSISKQILFLAGIFGISFGLIESVVVIYLRASTGLLPGVEGTILDIWRRAVEISYNQQVLSTELPISLLTFEFIREIGTAVMIISVAFLAGKRLIDRIAIAFWISAIWDIFYYAWLYFLIRWPESLTTQDLFFLIPEPWFGQVWFPILVSALTIIAIALNIKKEK